MPAATKEVCFFDRRYNMGLDWYASHFALHDDSALLGESSHTYWSAPDAPSRICATIPNVKLVLLIRDRVERAWSAFLHLWKGGRIGSDASFEEAADRFPDVLEDGHYGHYVQRWLEFFSFGTVVYIGS
jgi:hypothetical protein